MSFNTTFHFYRHNLIALSTLLKDTQYTTDRARRQLRILYISSLVIKLFSLLGKNKEGHTHPWCLVLGSCSSFVGSARSSSSKSDPDRVVLEYTQVWEGPPHTRQSFSQRETTMKLQVSDYPVCT